MKQLSALDAGFLQAEDSDPHISLAIGGVSVLEGPMPDFDELTATLAERLTRIPRLRQVLHTHTLDISAPEWEDRTDLDLSHHIRHAALPHPGDDAALYRLTADIIERRLDRDHPLWECWTIEGLADGRWALLLKLHHCLADGISAARILDGLIDNGTDFAVLTTGLGSTAPKRSSILPRPSLNPADWARTAWNLSTAATSSTVRAAKGAVSVLSGLLSPAASTSLSGPLSSLRRYQAARVSLEDINAVCRAFNVTLNDVALAAITHAYREVLLHRGEKPADTALRTLVPVSVRDTGDPQAHDSLDNRVSLMLPLLPVNRVNPLDQLRIVHRRMTTAKSGGQRQAGMSAVGAAAAIPFPLTAWTVRALTRLPQRGIVALATNVPGPRQHVQIMGRDVITMMPIPPIALRLRTGIGMLSYGTDLTFGIVADYASSPDLDLLADGIEAGVARLADLARRRTAKV